MPNASLALSTIFLAFRAVTRNRLRTALTVLGITIGIAAFVSVWALGTAARKSISDQIASLGSSAMIVMPRSTRLSGAQDNLFGSRLSERDCDALVEGSTSIGMAAPFLRAAAQVIRGSVNTAPSVIGTRTSYFDIRSWHTKRGNIWQASAETIAEKVVVIGQKTALDLFGREDPVGQTVRIARDVYEVVGVLEEKGQSPFGNNQDEIVLMPITTMRGHVVSARAHDVHALLLSATSDLTTDRAKEQAEQILRQKHHIEAGGEDDFMIRSQAEFRAIQEAIYGVLSTLLLGVAGISLLVGGIGVMNIMLVSVTERTREIGIRMAIGARKRDILLQFLTEAVVLALLGGIAGATLGQAAVFAFSKVIGWEMNLDPRTLFVALATSTAIGIFFGFFPANRAARMNPVDALGRE